MSDSTPITTKSSVGANKKRRYNEVTGPWRGMHDICKKGEGEETVRAEKKKKKKRERQLNGKCDVWSGG